LIGKSVALANINAEKKGTSLRFNDGTAGLKFPLDAEKIKQVVDNLLSNAAKFSPPGSLIQVSSQTGDGRIAIWVRDQGPGIPDADRGKLFKDFGQTSVKPTGGEKSTGLGLAICKKLIEAHHGTICADNEPDGGCTFKISLPLKP